MLESTLTNQEFNKLYDLAKELPNVNKYNITRALNAPSRISFELLMAIAPIVKKSVYELIIKYGCSIDVITAREFMNVEKTEKAIGLPVFTTHEKE